MTSLRSLEGYILIDHKNSPGVPAEIMQRQGLPADAGRKDRIFESATFTCADCHVVVIMNPDRSRSRGYCPKCNHYLCDECEAERFASGGECKNLNNRIDVELNRRARLATSTEAFQSPVLLTA